MLSIRLLPSQLRPQLVAITAAVVSVCVLGFAFYQGKQIAQVALNWIITETLAQARAYAEAIDVDSQGRPPLVWKQYPVPAVNLTGIISMRVIDRADHNVFRTPGADVDSHAEAEAFAPHTALESRPRIHIEYKSAVSALGMSFGHLPDRVIVSYPIGDRAALGWVLLSRNASPARDMQWEAFNKALQSGFLTLGACIAVVIMVIRRPLRELRSATKFVSRLDSRFGELAEMARSTLELHHLTAAINWASKRLSEQHQALQIGEAQKRGLLERLNEVVFQTDNRGRWIYLNSAWTAITGFSVEETLGNLSIRFIHPTVQGTRAQLVRALLDPKNANSRQQMQFVTKAGAVRWLEVCAQVDYDENGAVAGMTGTLVDIHDRYIAERNLRDQLRFTEQMLDAIPTPVFYRASDGCFLGVNRAYTELFGYPIREYLGKTAEELMSSDLAQAHLMDDTRCMESGGALSYETQITVMGGEVRHVICTKAPFRTAEGKVAGLIGVFSDVTERQRAERSTAKARKFLHCIIDAVPNPIFVKDHNARLVLVNDAWLRITGTSRDVALGKTADQLEPAQQEITSCSLTDVNSPSDEAIESESRVTDAEGRARRILKRTSRFSIPEGEDFVIGVISDITNISNAMAGIEAQLRFTRELVEALPLPVFVKDRTLRYILINRAAADFFCVDSASAVGKYVDDFQPQPLARIHREAEKQVLEIGSSLTYEAPYINANGDQRDTIVTKTPFTNIDGTIAGVIGTIADVTKRKRIEKRLQLQYDIERILTDATSVSNAALRIMQLIGTELNYVVGVLWELEEGRQYLECAELWCAPGYDNSQLRAQTRGLRMAQGMSLPGQVWESGKPQRATSIASSSALPQLTTGFGFPVKIDAGVIAVMHFFGGRAEEADIDLVAMLEATGRQIGQFMQRQRMQHSLRTSEATARKLSLVASHTSNAVIITDTNGRIDWVNDGFTAITGYTRIEANTRRLDEILHGPETDTGVAALMDSRMAERKGFTAEMVNYRRSGEKYWVRVEVQPVFTEAQELTNFIVIETEITERKLSEDALVQANIRLNLALECANLALWDWHVPSNTVYLSEMWSVMLGGAKRDTTMPADDLGRLLPDGEMKATRAMIAAALRGTNDVYHAVHRVKGYDGEWRWIQAHGKVVERDGNGRALRVAGINADVTERHRAELALRNSEERYNLAVNGSKDGIWDLNIAEQTWYLSPRFSELLPIQPDADKDILERWHDLFHPDDRAAEMHALQRHLIDNEPYDVELRMGTIGGQFRWFRVRGKALEDTRGVAYRIAGSIADTTDYRLAREQLEETRDRLDSILRSAEHMIWSRSTDLRTLLYINPAVRNIYQQAPEDFYANPQLWLDAVLPEDKERVLTAMSNILEKGNLEIEFRIMRPDGTMAWINDRVSVAHNALGEAVRIDVITSDITELKSRETELRSAKEVAEAATRAKSEFLANMSHEIRTPMNGIIGISDLALSGKLNSEQREYIEMVRSSATALLELINDILDFSKIEAHMLHFEHAEFLLRETLADSVKLMAVRAEEKGLELIWRVAEDVPDLLLGDPLRLRQVVTNLLSNAVKFTTHGEVELCVGISEPVGEQAKLVFAVRDTGIGIPKEKLESVFQPFSQADMSTTRKYGGTGLGLTICDRLVAMMGGSMSVASVVDRGSTFYFTAEFDVAQNSTVGPDPVMDLAGVKVLVCDDNPSQLVSISETLYSWGMHCRATDDFHQALSVLEAAAADAKPFDLAICDSQLSGPDYKKLVQRIRTRAQLQELPLIMLMPVKNKRAKGRGRHTAKLSYVTKPFSYSEFQQAIALAIGRGISARQPQTTVAKPTRRLHVLLVEDNEINIRFARGLVEKLGHKVTVARNGVEAVQAVSSDIGGQFDLALMDIQMPLMSGLEATGAIRIFERGTQRHLPIIAMTANAMSGDRERCIECGMDDYIPKPVVIPKLVEAIERTVTHSVDHIPEPPRKSVSRKARRRAKDSALPGIPFDRDAVLDTLHDDQEAFRELSQMLLEDHQVMLDEAALALSVGDFEKAASIAHTLKGMIGNFAAPDASKAAQAFYAAAHGAHPERSAKAFERLKSRLSSLAEALRNDPILAAAAS